MATGVCGVSVGMGCVSWRLRVARVRQRAEVHAAPAIWRAR